jgi:hypothetical protein
MRLPNIDFMMELTKDFLDGKIDGVSYSLDFEYYLEKRIEDMEKEDEDYCDLIYEYLYENGVVQFDDLSDEEFETLIRKHYKKIKKIAREGFY